MLRAAGAALTGEPISIAAEVRAEGGSTAAAAAAAAAAAEAGAEAEAEAGAGAVSARVEAVVGSVGAAMLELKRILTVGGGGALGGSAWDPG